MAGRELGAEVVDGGFVAIERLGPPSGANGADDRGVEPGLRRRAAVCVQAEDKRFLEYLEHALSDTK